MRKLLVFLAVIIPFTVQADVEKGKATFQTRCSTCHGPQGAGDGPVAASLPADQKPRNLQVGPFKVWNSDEKFKELINKGGPAFGLNPLMAAQPMPDAELADLLEFVKTLKK